MSMERFDLGTARDGMGPMMWRMVAIATVGFGVLGVLILLTRPAEYREPVVPAPSSAEPMGSGAAPQRARLLRHGSFRLTPPTEL
jgi:hypothetical protein